jgi:hypothetical protein
MHVFLVIYYITGVYGYDNAANRWMSLIKCIT